MEIGVVVHGPNIVDSGYALKIIKLLKNYGNVSAKLGGTMGRTAVIDNSLEDMIDISEKLFPSQSLKYFHDKNKDVIFLLNYGKSSVTGQVFGYKVVNNYFDIATNRNIPIVQIERPGEEDGSIIVWNGEAEDIEDRLAEKLKLNKVTPLEIHNNYFKENYNDSTTRRSIHGVSSGENIMVNGIIIGKANEDSIVLVAEDGIIKDIEGGRIKHHGVEKLGEIDLNSAVVKTGLLRKSDVSPRILKSPKKNSNFKIGFINHAGEDVYSYNNCDLVVTVGDDTTLISSDILYRFDIPIIGIADGDLDKVVEHGFKSEKSRIFKVEEGFDDIIGSQIHEKIFNGKDIIEIKSSKNQNDAMHFIQNSVIEILNNMNCKYIIE